MPDRYIPSNNTDNSTGNYIDSSSGNGTGTGGTAGGTQQATAAQAAGAPGPDPKAHNKLKTGNRKSRRSSRNPRSRRRKPSKPAPYRYEDLYTQDLSELGDIFREQMAHAYKHHTYMLKEIVAGEQLDIDIYPRFNAQEVSALPEEAQPKKRNREAQNNLNDRRAREYIIRLLDTNFTRKDMWLTLTYDGAHLPPDGDMDAALKDMQNFMRRVNRRRKKKGLPNAKYVYITEYDPYAAIRWHHHVTMDGLMGMDEVLDLWTCASRNQAKRLEPDEYGFAGMGTYIVKNKNRLHCEKRWRSSKGNLKKPEEKVVCNKPTAAGRKDYRPIERYIQPMIRDHEQIRQQLTRWFPDYIFTQAEIYYNDFNGFFYIRGKMRRKKGAGQDEATDFKKHPTKRNHRTDRRDPVGGAKAGGIPLP